MGPPIMVAEGRDEREPQDARGGQQSEGSRRAEGEAGGGGEEPGGGPGRECLGEPAGFFATAGGFEYPAFLGFTAAAIGVAGAGRYSLDHATGHVLDRPWTVALAFLASAAAAAVVVGRRAQGQAGGEDTGAETDASPEAGTSA
ncbi:hypothetical protein ACFVYD_31000 [Streptomyces sp. NPDC058301]|uniref:hypothetical protein n=1 Tax=Streptomyces sp. NPDC058301 TaxID=3346436 RepID=UPI0036EA9C96